MATVAKGGSLEEGAAEEQLGQSKGSSLVEVTTDGVHGWTWALGVRPAARLDAWMDRLCYPATLD